MSAGKVLAMQEYGSEINPRIHTKTWAWWCMTGNIALPGTRQMDLWRLAGQPD